ncbi:MAG TPA: hypothetical protein VK894_00620 [Jiangellales bacterium]|nr:hypothetical protein [Jiangellales bacterium]
MLVGVVLLLAAACGADDTGTSATTPEATTTADATTPAASPQPSGSGDVCAARDDLQQSLAALGGVDVVAGGTDALEAAVGDVEDDLAAVRSAAGSEVEPEVTAFEDAVQGLQDTLGEAATPATGDRLTALAEVVTAGGALVQALQSLPCEQ